MIRLLTGLLVGALLAPSQAFATAPPTNPEWAYFTARNLIQNPGAEQGKYGWTASGGTFAIDTSAPGTGNADFQWTPSGAQNVTSTLQTIPAGSFGQNAMLRCRFKTASTALTLAATDGTNTLASATIATSSNYTYQSVNFVMPSSGSVQMKLSASGSTTVVNWDDCYLGDAINLAQVSQAQFMGSERIGGSSCSAWSVTGNSTFQTPAAATGCTYTVTGSVSAPGTQLAQVNLNNAAPGTYLVISKGTAYTTTNNTQVTCRLVDDATTDMDQQSGFLQNTGNASGVRFPITLTGWVTYSTAANHTFGIQCESSAGTVNIGTGDSNISTTDQNLNFEVWYFPSASQTGVRPDTAPASWAGYHNSSCNWARTSTTYGDPSAPGSGCALVQRDNVNFGSVTGYGATSGTSALPGIIFTPPRIGRYMVCAGFAHFNSATTGLDKIQLTDGSAVQIWEVNHQHEATGSTQAWASQCGIYSITSTASVTFKLQTATNGANTINLGGNGTTSEIEWSVIELTASMAAPFLQGSVTSNNSGAVRHESARVTCSNSASAVNASAGTGSSWVSSVSNGGATGQCTVNFTSGIFSAEPACQCQVIGAANAAASDCLITANASTSSVALDRNRNALAENGDVYLTCTGTH